jgi:hypothetical protein
MEATTRLPQGSPVSQVLFAIYMADIHDAVERKDYGVHGLSFVDDVTWLVEANSIPGLVRKLEWCARRSHANMGGAERRPL